MALNGGSMKLKVLVRGPVLTRSGYGEQARFAMRSLRSRPDLFEIFIIPITWGATSWVNEDNEERRWMDERIRATAVYSQQGGKFDVSMQVTIPNEFEQIAQFNIGYTAGIETTKVAHEWLQAVNSMDHVMVVSNHSKNVFESTSYTGKNENDEDINLVATTRIDAVNYPVKTYENLEDIELELKHDINFITMAQFGPRKNIENTIKWFVEEFRDDEVGLVVKGNMSKNSQMDRTRTFWALKNTIQEYGDIKCKVYLLHGDMSDEEIHSLYLHPKIKAYLGFPHGEGFGLPFFEAAYSGLPVISPGWSGQLDFLTDENGKDHFYNVSYDLLPVQPEVVWDKVLIKESMWAYARETSAKKQMRQCYDDVLSGKELPAVEYAKQLKERFSEENMFAAFANSVINAVKSKSNLPKDWGAPIEDIEADYIFVSDIFKHQYVGGAELSLDALITSCPGKSYSINSESLTKDFVDIKKDATWIFGNIANLSPEVISHVIESDLEYYFIEFDYKFCEYRNPTLYEKLEEEKCNYNETEQGKLIESFVNCSSKTFFMSEGQLSIYNESLSGLNKEKTTVLSSIFDDQFFSAIDEIRNDKNIEKEDKWIVLGSRSWVKGSSESEEWCKQNNLNYEVISGLPYVEVLKKLASSKGICFKPTALDTCPRFVIEAKTLGCELELNDNVQHTNENWFNSTSVEEMLEYLKTRRETFWNEVAPPEGNQSATAK